MKLFVGEQLLECGLLLRSIGYNAVLVNETGFQKDKVLIDYAVKLYLLKEESLN